MPPTIFRFDQLKYAEPFVQDGIVSFGPAAAYNDNRLTDAQRDNELRRSCSPDVARHQIAVGPPGEHPKVLQNLLSIKVNYDIKDVSGVHLRYHILCCSLCNDSRFYAEFPVDCCITIHDTAEFHRRLDASIHAQLPEWGGEARGVMYYSPDESITPDNTLDLMFMKDKSYEWQKEFRYVLISPLEQAHNNRVTLKLGSLEDICSIAPK